MIVDDLTANGVTKPKRPFQPPFTDDALQGRRRRGIVQVLGSARASVFGENTVASRLHRHTHKSSAVRLSRAFMGTGTPTDPKRDRIVVAVAVVPGACHRAGVHHRELAARWRAWWCVSRPRLYEPIGRTGRSTSGSSSSRPIIWTTSFDSAAGDEGEPGAVTLLPLEHHAGVWAGSIGSATDPTVPAAGWDGRDGMLVPPSRSACHGTSVAHCRTGVRLAAFMVSYEASTSRRYRAPTSGGRAQMPLRPRACRAASVMLVISPQRVHSTSLGAAGSKCLIQLCPRSSTERDASS